MCRFAGEADFIQVTTLNISQSGMLVEGHGQAPIGTGVEFRFVLENGMQILWGPGTVVRHAQPGRPHTLGIAFGALEPANQRILARIVELNSDPLVP